MAEQPVKLDLETGGTGTVLLPPDTGIVQPLPISRSEARQQSLDNILTIIREGIAHNIPVESLKELQLMLHGERDRAAAQEFAEAKALFQDECPSIVKKTKADVDARTGARFSYRYAELDQIAAIIGPFIHKRGLSYDWDSVTDEKGWITMTCILFHVNGHQRTSSVKFPPDSSAGMSPQQKVVSAMTFARRQSLVMVLGLTTTEEDIDGGTLRGTETITVEQVERLDAFLAEVNADRDKFFAFMGVTQLANIRASDYGKAIVMLEKKKAKQK